MDTFPLAITATFIAYLLVVLFIGYIAWRRTHNASDYFLANRQLGPWPAALSAGASDMSGWLLLGVPGLAFVSGLEVVWLAGGLLLGTWANWLLVAKRFRVYTERAQESITLPEYFSRRFNDNARVLQVIAAFFILLFFLFYTSSGLVAGGKLFTAVFGFDYVVAVVIGALFIVSYTLFGGFFAVCWTDLVQGLLMLAALFIVPIVALQATDGVDAVFHSMQQINPNLLTLFDNNRGEPLTVIAIVSLLGWGLGYFGQPHILARFAAVHSQAVIPTARRIAVTWTGLCLVGAMFVGFAGLVYMNSSLAGHTGIILNDPEAIFMVLVDTLFHPVIAGILLAAVLAAIMSTVDSQLLVSSSALAEDFYRVVVNKQASSERVMLIGRLAVVIILLIALALAIQDDASVLMLVSYAWAGLGAAFGPAVLLSLFWRRMNRAGALAGILVGGLTVLVWKQLEGGIFDLYELIPGFIFSLFAIVVVSWLTKKPDHQVDALFDEVESALQ